MLFSIILRKIHLVIYYSLEESVLFTLTNSSFHNKYNISERCILRLDILVRIWIIRDYSDADIKTNLQACPSHMYKYTISTLGLQF